MASNQQRRDAERLQRELEARRTRDASRKRVTLISSVVGTLVVIAAIVIVIVANSGNDPKPAASDGCPTSGQAGVVDFDGVSVGNATELTKEPKVCSKSTQTPPKLEYKDLVVGTGAAANPKSNVEVQYTGVTYQAGTQFDSSWPTGKPVPFPLTGVVPGFTQGIGGTTGVPAMKVGGRRIIILPAALGYPNGTPDGKIAANTPLVFVIDLTKVSA